MLQGHSTGHQIKCELCSIVFKTVGLLRRHNNADHSQTGNDNGNKVPPPAASTDGFSKKCSLCDFTAESNVQIQSHMIIQHKNDERNNQDQSASNMDGFPMKCSLCDFMVRSSIQLEKHIKVRHGNTEKYNQHCIHWLRGSCYRGNECKFKHEDVSVCRYGLQCPYWPNCHYFHPDVQPCKFQ